MAVASSRREHGLLLLNQWMIEEEHATHVFHRRFRARPYFSCFPPTLLVSSLHSIVNELKVSSSVQLVITLLSLPCPLRVLRIK